MMRPLPRSGRHRFDRLHRVLDDVGERLRDQPPVEAGRQFRGGKLDLEADLGVPHPHQEHHLPDGFGKILALHHRLRRAGESGKLVDHPADIADLADDGLRALLEDLAVVGQHFAVFAPQALRRQLNGGQRILDLVRDAPRDVGPGRGSLRRNKLGDVVEGHHIAVFRLRRGFRRHPHVDRAFASAAHELDRAVHALFAGERPLGQRRDLRNLVADRNADEIRSARD